MAEELKKNAEEATPEKKSEKVAEKKEKKPAKKSFVTRIKNFFKEYRSELKKVAWYPANRVWHDTGIVVAALVVFGLLIGAMDLLFTQLILLLGQIG